MKLPKLSRPAFLPVFASLLPLFILGCTALERAEVAKDLHDNVVPVLTNPASYTNWPTGVAALIGALSIVAGNYIKRKFWNKDSK